MPKKMIFEEYREEIEDFIRNRLIRIRYHQKMINMTVEEIWTKMEELNGGLPRKRKWREKLKRWLGNDIN